MKANSINGWMNGRFSELRGDRKSVYYTDNDLEEVVKNCKGKTSTLDKAICAGREVKRLHSIINGNRAQNFNKGFFKTERVCRHHTVFHAAALRRLGIEDFAFQRTYLKTWDGAHIWLAILIDDNIYFMDSVNEVYVQYDITLDKFNILGKTIVEVKLADQHELDFHLTPEETWVSGAVWSKYPISLEKSFFLEFQANFGTRNDGSIGSATNGGDGIMFVLQPTGDNIIGTTNETKGHFLSYHGVAGLEKSIGVEFDTWYWSDPNDPRNDIEPDHIAIVQDGNILEPLVGPVSATPYSENIEDGAWHDILITFELANPDAQLTVYFDDETTPVASYVWNTVDLPTEDMDMGLASMSKVAYWGFTSATGNAVNKQSVRLLNNIQYGLPGDSEYARRDFKWSEIIANSLPSGGGGGGGGGW